ncbi:hypothetical protein BHE74_00037338 [Ensete ventricosum]|nr:hypothetical protein BHE74_00037338 [Ensete ventricosum]
MHYHNRKRSRLQINKRASKKRIPPPPASNPRKRNNLLPPNLTHQANPAPGGGSTATDNRHHPVIKIRRRRSRSRAARPPGSDHNAADGGRGLAGGADRSPGTSKSASGGGNYHPKWREAIAARERARVGGSVRPSSPLKARLCPRPLEGPLATSEALPPTSASAAVEAATCSDVNGEEED